MNRLSLVLGSILPLVYPVVLHATEGLTVPSRWSLGATIGGSTGVTTPIPVPSEVKHVYRYYPTVGVSSSLWASYRLSPQRAWALTLELSGVRKVFTATTRAEDLPFLLPDAALSSRYTGDEQVHFSTYALSVPVMATYISPKERWRLHAGLYASYLIKPVFRVKLDGDGLMNGQTYQAGTIISLDLSERMRKADWGVRLGADYYLTEHWGASLRLDLGMASVLRSSFNPLNKGFHQIYANWGVSYKL